MKRILTILLAVLAFALPSHAVLKEKDLSRTLGVLRAELASNYERLQMFMQMYEQQGAQQHNQLVNYMTQCEQIGLMLYSQSQENTFDMAYACQQATSLYRNIHGNRGQMLPYDKVIVNMKREIARYEALIRTLKAMPPVVTEAGEESVLTESDSILMTAIDSLATVADSLQTIDSLMAGTDSGHRARPVMAMAPPKDKKKDEHQEPLYLSGQQLTDRAESLKYAEAMLEMLQKFLSTLEAESVYYTSVQTKVTELNKFAQSRYTLLKDNIFKTGSSNYFSVLASLPRSVQRAQMAFSSKYMPFKGHDLGYSEWRGTSVLFISVFLIFYLAGSLLLTYVLLRWLLPKRWRGKDYALKRHMLNMIAGIGLFAIIVMVVRTQVSRNFIQMGTNFIINIAWLMEVIFVSLYIRLKGEQMRHAAIIYTPLMVIAFIVILFRIVLIPDAVVNLIFPPILLGFTIWQAVVTRRHIKQLPSIDRLYTNITTLVLLTSCIISWAGFTLMSVQVIIWWTFQLAAIMTITCVFDLMELYEMRYIVRRIAPGLDKAEISEKVRAEKVKGIRKDMLAGKHFTRTWFYDLTRMTLVPILAVLSVLLSIVWAGSTFEMTDPFIEVFHNNFIDQEGLIQVSIEKLCQVAALWFIMRYVNYAVYNVYAYYRRLTLREGQTLNTTLARNVFSIVVWGLFAIITLAIFHVPSSGISIVSAGLATGVGFAMQNIIENFFYGLQLMAGRLRVGDFIECDGIAGKVESISYQSTQLVTADGSVIAFMNNALFSKNFKNMTRNHHYELIKIGVGVAYGSDVEHVRALILEAIAPLCAEKNAAGKPITNVKLKPAVVFSGFGDSSVDLVVTIWMRVEDKLALSARVKETIYNVLNVNHIEIPFPQRDIHIIPQNAHEA